MDAIDAGDADKAVNSTLSHLDHIEKCLELSSERSETVDIEAALR